MLRCVSYELVPLTLSLAEKFRDMNSLNNERPLKKARVRDHLALLYLGRFFTMHWGCCESDGVVYRVNGNHTSNLMTVCLQAHTKDGLDERSREFFDNFIAGKSGGISVDEPADLPKLKENGLQVFVETFSATTADDLITCFRRYDSASSARSQGDVLGIYIGEQEELNDLSRERVKCALNGVLPVVKRQPKMFGMSSGEAGELSKFRGASTGSALRVPCILKAVRWIVESVPFSDLYKNSIGAQVCAEVYASYGEELGAKILDEMVKEIEADVDPSAAFEQALNKKHNKPTPETIMKKGRMAVSQIAKNINAPANA